MLKKVLTIFLSVIILLSLGTVKTVYASVNNVAQAIAKADNFPSNANDAWTNESGGKLYNYTGMLKFQNADGSVTASPYNSNTDTDVTESGNTATANTTVSGSSDTLTLTFHFNSSDKLTSIDATFSGSKSELSGTYRPQIKIGDLIKGMTFPSSNVDAWITTNDNESFLYKTENPDQFYFTHGSSDHFGISTDTVLTYVSDTQYKYISTTPDCEIFFNLENNVLKSVTISGATGQYSPFCGTYVETKNITGLISSAIPDQGAAIEWVDNEGKPIAKTTTPKGTLGGKEYSDTPLSILIGTPHDIYKTRTSVNPNIYTFYVNHSTQQLEKITYKQNTPTEEPLVTYEPYSMKQNNLIVRQGSASSVDFRINCSFDDYEDDLTVYLGDDELIKGTDYTIREGSIIISLTNEAVQDLATETPYTLKAKVTGFKDVTATFTLMPPLPPSTPDPSPVASNHQIPNTGVK